MSRSIFLLAFLTASSLFCVESDVRSRLLGEEPAPNIVLILCDDLGYGDVQPNNPESKIKTPSFNRLAKEGVRFTDAHTPSGVCTPTRYGLLCGRYPWRTRMKSGVLGGYSKPLLASDQPTIASLLKGKGYHTGCVGKWHLGLGWQWNESAPKNINNFGVAGTPGSVDYRKPITDGPTNHGFDWSYIIPASLDMSPYVYIENDRVTSVPDKLIDGKKFPAFYRKGEIADDFKIVDVLGHLTEKATDFIAEQSKTEKPFFLYFPMPAPHKPVVPTKSFEGKSKLGPYGDFVMQVDDAVGRVLTALDTAGAAQNTVVIVTSDNGSFMNRLKDGRQDHVSNPTIQGFIPQNHLANGRLRGTKADIWEGGNRVPFFVRWPGMRANVKDDTVIGLVDVLATVCDVVGAKFDSVRNPDTYSFKSLIDETYRGIDFDAPNAPMKYFRKVPLIMQSVNGMLAIREKEWKLVLGSGSGGRQQPRGKKFERPFGLYNLAVDLSESNNVISENRDVAERLEKLFGEIADGDQFPSK